MKAHLQPSEQSRVATVVTADRAASRVAEERSEHTTLSLDMSYLFVGRTTAMVFTVLIPLVLVRLLTQHEFGLYKQLFLLQATVVAFLSFGIPSSLFYFLPTNPARRATYVSQTFLLLGGVGLVAYIALLFGAPGLAIALNNPQLGAYVADVGLLIAVTLVGLVLETAMIAGKQNRLAAVVIVFFEILKSVAMIGAIVSTGQLISLIRAVTIVGFLRILIAGIYLRKQGLLAFRELRWSELVGQLSYAIPFGLAFCLETFAVAAPQFLVSAHYDPASFAIYSVGCFTLPIVPLLFDSVSEVTLVRITEAQSQGVFAHVADTIRESLRKLCLVCFPLVAFLFAEADAIIVSLFTSQFEGSVPIFRVYMFSIPFMALSLDYVPRAFAEPRFLFRFYGLRALLGVTLFFPLMGTFGLVGGALATVLALGVSRVYSLYRARELARTTLRRIVPSWDLARILLCSIFSALVVAGFKQLAADASFMRLVSSFLLYCTIFFLLAWKAKLFRDGDRDLLRSWLGRAKVVPVEHLTDEGA